MIMKVNMWRRLVVSVGGTVLLLSFGKVFAQAESSEWRYSLTPYLWLPTIDGVLNFNLPPGGGGSPNVSVGPTDWLDLLNFGILVNGSAKKDRFSLMSDLVYLSMSSDDSRVVSVDDPIPGPGLPVPVDVSLSVNTKTDLDGLLWMLAAGYEIDATETSSMDMFAGVRYLGTDISTRWNLAVDITAPGGGTVLPAQGSVSQDTDLWDAIIGVRGNYGLSQKWTVPFYLDVGMGSSDLTWQGMVGVTYAVGWGELVMVFRHLEYDEDSSGLMQNFSFSGPAFGARFNF
jgi:hypothetical protein